MTGAPPTGVPPEQPASAPPSPVLSPKQYDELVQWAVACLREYGWGIKDLSALKGIARALLASNEELETLRGRITRSYIRNCYLKAREGDPMPFSDERAAVQLDGYAIVPLEDLPLDLSEQWIQEWLPKAISRAVAARGEGGTKDG